MPKIDLHEVLRGKWEDGTRPKDLFAEHLSKRPAVYVEDLLAGLASKEKRVQGGCAELCSLLSEAEPALLADHLDLFVRNLDAKAPILRWEAVCTVGNLAAVDSKAKLPKVVERITALLDDESIVLQGHAVRALSKIATAHPSTAPRILAALIGSKERFPGNRVGYVVEAMETFAGTPDLAAQARVFVEPFVSSEVSSVKTKAKRVMKKLA